MGLLVAVPFLLLLVLFALSNQAPIQLGIWPTDFSVNLPISLAILGAMAIAFLFGGILVWISELGQRRRARRAEQAVQLLEAQVQELKSRLAAPPASPPAV